MDRKCLFIVLYFRSSCASTSEKSSSSSLKRLSASSTRNKRDRKERKEVFSREKSSKKSVMGGNVSRGIRHAHRDGGAGRGGTAASKAGGGNSETKMPTRLEMLLDMPTVSRETQIKNAWNSESRNISSTSFSHVYLIAGEDRSLNIFVKDEDKLTFHRHPVAQSTDCIRSKVTTQMLPDNFVHTTFPS